MSKAIGAPVFEVRGLCKRYVDGSGTELPMVLNDVTFVVREGEVLTIVGPSGAGKTTLLNVMAQVDYPSAGEVCLGSEVLRPDKGVALNPGWSCRVGYVTQEDNLLPWRTALENVLLPLEVQCRLTRETQAYARALIKMVGISGFENYYPDELSVGMRKRVSLARTLVYEPPVILMDEPFCSVDAETRAALQEVLISVCVRGRKTIIFVTHDIAEAIALGDRALVLTSRPATVRSETSIAISRPRDIRGVIADPRFAMLYRDLRAQIEPTCGS